VGTGNKNSQYRFQQADNIKGGFVIVTVNPGGFVVMYEVFVFHIGCFYAGLTIRMTLKVCNKSKIL